MNIRSLSNPAQVLGKENIESAKSIKSSETAEREANGQQAQGESPDFHRPLSEEEVEQVLEKLRSHEGIQQSELQVHAYTENNQNIVKIESPEGQVVKTILERELFFYLFQEDKDSLKLVAKSA